MIYSWYVRQFYRNWRHSFRHFVSSVVGRPVDTTVSIVLPGNARELSAFVPEDHRFSNFQSLAGAHTPIPVLTQFESNELRTETCNRWVEGSLIKLRLFLGLNHSPYPLQPSRLRYCKQCVTDDVSGSIPPLPYWRIVHQLPTVFVCPIHRVPLVDGCEVCGGPHWTRMGALLPGTCDCGLTTKHRVVKAPFDCGATQLALLATWTAVAQSRGLTSASSSSVDFTATLLQGLNLPVKQESYSSIIRGVKSKFGQSCLDYYQIASSDRFPPDPIETGPAASRAFARLVIASAHFESLEAFLKNIVEATKQTARGQKEDIRAPIQRKLVVVAEVDRFVAEHFDKLGGNVSRIASELRLPKNHVAAAAARMGLKTISLDATVVSAVREEIFNGVNKSDIAKKLGLTDLQVATAFLLQPSQIQLDWKSTRFRQSREKRRLLYLSVLKSERQHSRLEIRAFQRARRWLIKSDIDWISAQNDELRLRGSDSKGRSKITVPPDDDANGLRDTGRSVDATSQKWAERDESLNSFVLARAKELRQIRPRVQVTAAQLVNGHPMRHRFNQQVDRFPVTKALVARFAETREQFILRCFQSVIREQMVLAPKLSKREVSKVLNIHLRTIRRYWHLMGNIRTEGQQQTER